MSCQVGTLAVRAIPCLGCPMLVIEVARSVRIVYLLLQKASGGGGSSITVNACDYVTNANPDERKVLLGH